MLNFITDQCQFPGHRLSSDSYLIQAIEIMLSLEQYELPVYDGAKYIGNISFSEITTFLTKDSGLLFHKLYFNTEVLIFIRDQAIEECYKPFNYPA